MFKRHIMRGTLCLFVLSLGLYLGLSPAVHAQSKEDSGKGLIWYEGVMGTSSSLGSVTRFDSTLGYNFNHHFGVDFGAPVLFVHSSSTTTTTYRSANGIGDVYTDLRFTFRNPVVNFVSTIRGTAPTGSTANGFSSGRATADWNNHFDRAFGGVTPFADLGVANTVPDSAYFVRPYTTLGLTGHFDGGAGVRILPLVNLRVFFQAEDGIRDLIVTGVQTCALPILAGADAVHVPGRDLHSRTGCSRSVARTVTISPAASARSPL